MSAPPGGGWWLSGLAFVGGCAADLNSSESALNPAGPQARELGGLTSLFLVVCGVVFVLIMITLVAAFARRRRAPAGAAADPADAPVTEPDAAHERRMWRTVSWATGVTVVTLFALLFCDFATGRAIQAVQSKPDPLRISVIAHQWWWEVQYQDWPARFGERYPSNMITIANEIHIPVDPANPVAVEFRLDSTDVIHSFWVPNLHGKRDIIPGHPTSFWIEADRPGTYWGECAEYCGAQHAQMRLAVVAEPVEQFQSWLDGQRQEAPEPGTYTQTQGRNVFMSATCAMCHSIQGTDAGGRVGPDLTHVASRKILAAGAIPNTKGHMASWIIDPQRIKPGTKMKQINLAPADLRSLLDYLETLK